MAIWQYTFEIIPNVILLGSGAPGFITAECYDNGDFWKKFGGEIESFDSLTAEMKSSKSWSDEILLYGDNESTCIKLFLENDKVSGIDVRLDFRDDYSAVLSSIIEFCRLEGFVILDDLEILDLNATSLIYHIENSKQFITYNKLSVDLGN